MVKRREVYFDIAMDQKKKKTFWKTVCKDTRFSFPSKTSLLTNWLSSHSGSLSSSLCPQHAGSPFSVCFTPLSSLSLLYHVCVCVGFGSEAGPSTGSHLLLPRTLCNHTPVPDILICGNYGQTFSLPWIIVVKNSECGSFISVYVLLVLPVVSFC